MRQAVPCYHVAGHTMMRCLYISNVKKKTTAARTAHAACSMNHKTTHTACGGDSAAWSHSCCHAILAKLMTFLDSSSTTWLNLIMSFLPVVVSVLVASGADNVVVRATGEGETDRGVGLTRGATEPAQRKTRRRWHRRD
jgi:hypothetical protein